MPVSSLTDLFREFGIENTQQLGGLVATLASNTIHYRNATAELQEEKFYVLWKLSDK